MKSKISFLVLLVLVIFTTNRQMISANTSSTTTLGGVNLGNLPDYLLFYSDANAKANWQGATKGFVGNVAINGIVANETTSGGVPYAGTIYTNDGTLGAWQNIVNQNATPNVIPSQAFGSYNNVALILSLKTQLNNVFTQINALPASPGYSSVFSTSLNGLNTQNGIPERFVINITSGFSISSQINITGDAGDIYILRWDTDANFANGYDGQVKFQSGGAIVPHGGLKPTNFLHVAGNLGSSGGGSNPPLPYPQGPRYGNGLDSLIDGGSDFNGGGFFTGYWFTTGDPSDGKTSSLSNGIFVGGWYSTTTEFSMTSGTSGVYVSPPTPPSCSCNNSTLPTFSILNHPDASFPNQQGRIYYRTSGTTAFEPVACGVNDGIEIDPCDPWTLEFYALLKDPGYADCVNFDSASISWDTVTYMDFKSQVVYPVGYPSGGSTDSIVIKFTITTKPSDTCFFYSPYVCSNGDTLNIGCWPAPDQSPSVKMYGHDACSNIALCEINYVNTSLLPVELESFTSEINGNNVTLNWATVSELNNKGFDVERADSRAGWQKIGFVNGNGTSSTGRNYSFTEGNLGSGRFSYRLKQIDYNGNFEYFNLSSDVVIGVPTAFSVSQNYPNPFNPSTKINYDIPVDGKVSLKIFDMSGKEVASLVDGVQSAGYYTVTLNANNLSSGMYFYRVTVSGSQNFVMTKKMVLLK